MYNRSYYINVRQELAAGKSMIFISGPRQAGKTTLSKHISRSYTNNYYFNWDIAGTGRSSFRILPFLKVSYNTVRNWLDVFERFFLECYKKLLYYRIKNIDTTTEYYKNHVNNMAGFRIILWIRNSLPLSCPMEQSS